MLHRQNWRAVMTEGVRPFQFVRRAAGTLLFTGLVLISGSGLAQTPPQSVDRAQLLRTQPPTLRDDGTGVTGTDNVHAVASPNDPDLGEQAILKRAEEYQAFTFVASVPLSYTSNVALVRRGAQGDFLFSPSVGFLYAPRITRTLYGTIGVGQQFFYYDKFGELNFGSFDAQAGLTYSLPQLRNLIVRGAYRYNRLTFDDSFDEFFSNHSIALGAEMPFRFGRAQQLSVGLDLDFSLHAEPAQPRRHDYSVFAGYAVNLTRALTLNAVGRLALRDYVQGDRTDFSAILALGGSYRITRWFSANAIATLATSDSNINAFDYDVVNLGGALTVVYKF
ncbi:hypothetical protein BH20VER2_BH20VER2_09330 [soil metagenome]